MKIANPDCTYFCLPSPAASPAPGHLQMRAINPQQGINSVENGWTWYLVFCKGGRNILEMQFVRVVSAWCLVLSIYWSICKAHDLSKRHAPSKWTPITKHQAPTTKHQLMHFEIAATFPIFVHTQFHENPTAGVFGLYVVLVCLPPQFKLTNS